MSKDSIELGHGSRVRFVRLDRTRIHRDRTLSTIQKYQEAGSWPAGFKTVIVSFKKEESVARLLDPYIKDEYVMKGLVNFSPGYYVEKKRSVITFPKDIDCENFNLDKSIIARAAQRRGDPDGYAKDMIIHMDTAGFCPPDLRAEHALLPINCINSAIEETAAINSYPGNKKDLLESPELFIRMKKASDDEKGLLPYFNDILLATALCRFYPLGPDFAEPIIDRLGLPVRKQDKIRRYSHDLGEAIACTLGGNVHPTMEVYADALLNALDVFHTYDSLIQHENGETRISVVLPALTFRTLDKKEYTIETVSKTRIPSTDVPVLEPVQKSLHSRLENLPAPLYQNTGF